MDYYYHKFEKLQDEFHQTMHDFPLFSEMIDKIYDKDIKEINDLLEKNDEYYLKKAIDKIDRLIDYVKDTSESIDREYDKFDKLNKRVNKANELIKSHDLDDIKEANKIMEKLLNDVNK